MSNTVCLHRLMPRGEYVVAQIDTSRGYFGISGMLWEKRGTRSGRTRYCEGRDFDAGGQITEDILRAFPRLKPLLDLHLSTLNGVPMHAIENGWYFYQGHAADYAGAQGREVAAKLLRVKIEDLPEMTSKAEFIDFVQAQMPRWAEEARQALAFIEQLREEKESNDVDCALQDH